MKRVSRHNITHHRQIFISHNQKNGVLQLATSDEVAYTPPSPSFCSYCYYFYILQNSHKTLYAPGKQFYARSNFYSKFTSFMYVPYFPIWKCRQKNITLLSFKPKYPQGFDRERMQHLTNAPAPTNSFNNAVTKHQKRALKGFHTFTPQPPAPPSPPPHPPSAPRIQTQVSPGALQTYYSTDNREWPI